MTKRSPPSLASDRPVSEDLGAARRLKELKEQERSDLSHKEKSVLRWRYKRLKALGPIDDGWVVRRVRNYDWIQGGVVVHLPPSAKHPWREPISTEEACFYGWKAPKKRDSDDEVSERSDDQVSERGDDEVSERSDHDALSRPRAGKDATGTVRGSLTASSAKRAEHLQGWLAAAHGLLSGARAAGYER